MKVWVFIKVLVFMKVSQQQIQSQKESHCIARGWSYLLNPSQEKNIEKIKISGLLKKIDQ
jgi:hypothetical protein